MSGIPLNFFNTICDGIDYMRKATEETPNTKEVKEKFVTASLESTAVLIGSVALDIIGIGISYSWLGPIVGVPIILVGLPLGFASYNGYRVSENLLQVINHPKEYCTSKNTFDKEKLKKVLTQNTLLCSPAIDLLAEGIAKTPVITPK